MTKKQEEKIKIVKERLYRTFVNSPIEYAAILGGGYGLMEGYPLVIFLGVLLYSLGREVSMESFERQSSIKRNKLEREELFSKVVDKSKLLGGKNE